MPPVRKVKAVAGSVAGRVARIPDAWLMGYLTGHPNSTVMDAVSQWEAQEQYPTGSTLADAAAMGAKKRNPTLAIVGANPPKLRNARRVELVVVLFPEEGQEDVLAQALMAHGFGVMIQGEDQAVVVDVPPNQDVEAIFREVKKMRNVHIIAYSVAPKGSRTFTVEDFGRRPVVRGNPPRRKLARKMLSFDYVHAQDGKSYTHDFGEDRHTVVAYVEADGRRVVLEATNGDKIVEDF